MQAIHLIKKNDPGLPDIEKVRGVENTYKSGYWTLAEKTAQSLVGGRIYFHSRQREPSFFGGKIIEVEYISEGSHRDSIVFTFVYSKDCRNVKAGASGWSQEMKFV